MKRILLLCIITLLSPTTVAIAADNPWVGNWKLNPAHLL